MTNIVGFHGGNERPMTALDWRIIEMVPPGCFWFLSGQGIKPEHIWRLLGVSPGCHIGIRPYYAPREPTARATQEYIDQCRRDMDAYRDPIPRGQRHLQIYNEQNMPRWAQWEGFGDQYDDMRRFDEIFCQVYHALKAHDPSWLIGWTPLTPGNRDCWFPGDAVGHYYLHGPTGCKEALSAGERQAAINEGPCKASLELADEFYCHIYIHETRTAYKEPWRGLRFERYRLFVPTGKRLWITECGHPNRSLWPTWGDQAIIDWYETIKGRNVAGTALWILGDYPQWGQPFYDGGQPRVVVTMLAEWQKGAAMSTPTQAGASTADAEMTQLRALLAIQPATQKACIERGYTFLREVYASGDVHARALAYDPTRRKYVGLWLDSKTWKVVRTEELSGPHTV